MNARHIDRQIIRYITGSCSESEATEFERGLRNDNELRKRVEETRKIWQAKRDVRTGWNVDAADIRMRKEITSWIQKNRHHPLSADEKTFARPSNPIRHKRGRSFDLAFRVAAIITFFAFLSLFVTTNFSGFRVSEVEEEDFLEIVTDRGQRAHVQLKDGTFVKLNVDSKLTYPTEFPPGDRTVHLSGEAFFDVVSEDRPFYVVLDDAVVEVMGTSFNVEAYQDEENVKVLVVDGKVQVKSITRKKNNYVYTLGSRDMSIMATSGSGNIELFHDVDLYRHTAWLDQRLIFDNEPLERVARILERWYRIDIRIDDPALAQRKLTATFENSRLRTVLRILSISLDLDMEWQKDGVILFSEKNE